MNKALPTLIILSLGISLSAAPKPKDSGDTPLTLTGCVLQGETKGSFLITDLLIAGVPAPANTYYRLDNSKTLRNHIGYRVEITGLVDLDDHDKAKIKIEENDGKTETQVTSERQTVKADTSMWNGTAGATNIKADITSYGVEVKSVKRIEGNCRS